MEPQVSLDAIVSVSPECHAVSGSTVIEPRSAFAEDCYPYRVLVFSGNKVLLSLLTAAACAAAGCPAFLACSSLMSASTWATPALSECSACAGACVLRLFDCCITPSSSNAPNRVNSGLSGWFWAVFWGRVLITRTPRPWSHARRSAHTPASTGPHPASAPCPRPSTPDPPQPVTEAAP